jgi:tetratricopeptide (TPR) repeat protein
MNNLALSLGSLGRHKEALKLNEDTLALMKETLPKDHPDIATSMNNLALSLGSLGRHKEALKLQEETLALQKEILPKDHPDIAESMNNLAGSLMHFRRHRPAEALFKDAMLVRMRAGFNQSDDKLVNYKNGLHNAKSKSAIPKAIKLPKPKTPCSCGSGKRYRDCCF